MAATDIHCPDFSRRLTAALLDLKRAEAAWESASALAIRDTTNQMMARRLVVETQKLALAQSDWARVMDVVETSVKLEAELADEETR